MVALALALPMLLLSGCAGAPKPPPPTVIELTLEVAADANPDARGRASPIIVRLLELKSLAAFDSADFFSLFEKDQATLGSELVAREEFQFQPKDTRKLQRTLQSDTRHVAVIAAFRDLERAKWRAAIAVPLHKTTPVVVRVDARSISISTK
jgi:type VI secretion system protein VasD